MTRSLIVSFASLAFVIGLAGRASAGSHDYPPGGVTIDTPDDWQTSQSGDKKGAFLVTASPDQTAAIMVTVSDAKDVKKAQKLLKKLLAPVITKPKFEKAKPVELNTMKGITMDGAAVSKGDKKKVGLFVMVLAAPSGGKVIILVGVAEADKFAANKDTLMQIVQSLKPDGQ